jgi:hypothetical protein
MDDFNTIRLKRKTLEEFKEYSLKTSPNYSETLEFMIAFFKDTGISPYDTIRNPILASTVAIYRRLDYIIALLKDIEKTQLIPTREMLESLFHGVEKEEEKQPLYIERTKEEIEASKTEEERLIDHYHDQYEETREQLVETRNYLLQLLDDLTLVKSTFGKDYYRLDIAKEKIEEIKAKYVI